MIRAVLVAVVAAASADPPDVVLLTNGCASGNDFSFNRELGKVAPRFPGTRFGILDAPLAIVDSTARVSAPSWGGSAPGWPRVCSPSWRASAAAS